MTRFLLFPAITLMAVASSSCNWIRIHNTRNAPQAAIVSPETATETASAPAETLAPAAPLPSAPAAPPRGLRDPDLLSDLPDERQFEPTRPQPGRAGDAPVIASPPPRTGN